jgi:hypothetical protein
MLKCNHSGVNYPWSVKVGLDATLNASADVEWSTERLRVIREIVVQNPGIENDHQALVQLFPLFRLEDWHWRWDNKALYCSSSEYERFYLIADNSVQAIATIYHPKSSWIKGDNIFYIDYLAVANWNRDRPGYGKKFSGVGTKLLGYCINHAITVLKYRPGFCLHSLPGAETYYQHIGMQDLGLDSAKESLRRYEADEKVTLSLSS